VGVAAVTADQMWVTAVLVWLLWVFMAWCVGYAAGHRHDVRDQLDEHPRRYCQAHRAPAPPPVAVHVHVAAPLPWAPHHPAMPLDSPRFLDAMPVLPAQEVPS
jgi:hypothetical protein